jgi:HEAT repeat protein
VLADLLMGISHKNGGLTQVQTRRICVYVEHAAKAVRESLALALLGLTGKAAIDALITLSGDQSASIRDWASFGLAELDRDSSSIRAALWARVHDRHADTRAEAIIGLARRKDPRMVAIFEKELKRKNYGCGTLLFDAIAAMHTTSLLPTLNAIYTKEAHSSDTSERWLQSLLTCISRLQNPPEA